VLKLARGPSTESTLDLLAEAGSLPSLGSCRRRAPRLERALAIREAAYGPDHPEVARTLGNLGGVLRQLGALSEAQACEQRAQAIR